MIAVALGLGSNVGDRQALILAAVRRLEREVGRVVAMSPLFETEPWGIVDQPRFLNAACLVRTRLCALRLLAALQLIEAALGRVRTRRYGPRSIDLDILCYGDMVMSSARLTIPHPGMIHRASVLVPLAMIAPGLVHSLSGRSVASHLADLGPTPDVARFPPGLDPRPQATS